jgi:hypothetical protein
MHDLAENFANQYISYAKENRELYFLFGTPDSMTVMGYVQTEKTVSVGGGSGGSYPLAIAAGETGSYDFEPAGNTITLTIDGNVYPFDIKDGENFYFVISQETGGEIYIASNNEG